MHVAQVVLNIVVDATPVTNWVHWAAAMPMQAESINISQTPTESRRDLENILQVGVGLADAGAVGAGLCWPGTFENRSCRWVRGGRHKCR